MKPLAAADLQEDAAAVHLVLCRDGFHVAKKAGVDVGH
jgi:hypothetical protein